MALKPETSLTIAGVTGLMVYGIFQVEVGGSLSDLKFNAPHNTYVKGSINSAAWTSAAVVAGVSLLAKDPTIFVVGGAIAAALTWKYKHASMTNPANGQVTMPPNQGTPQANS
jgi:hypothetical protein